MNGRSVRAILVVSTLAGFLLGMSPAVVPCEPQGLILFETEGVTTPDEGAVGFEPGEKAVRLVLRSTRDLSGAVLVHQAPADVAQRLAIVRRPGEAARAVDPFDGKSPATYELGPIRAGVPITLEFAERFLEGKGGIVSFTIDAVTSDGKLTREAYGQVVGTPGPAPILRDGILEFPAHQIPAEAKP